MTHHELGKLSLCVCFPVPSCMCGILERMNLMNLMNLQDLHLLIPELIHNMLWYLLIFCPLAQNLRWRGSLAFVGNSNWWVDPGVPDRDWIHCRGLQRHLDAKGKYRVAPWTHHTHTHTEDLKNPQARPFWKTEASYSWNMSKYHFRSGESHELSFFFEAFEDRAFAFSFSIILLNLLLLTFDLAFKLEIMKWLWFTPFSCFVVPKSSEHVLWSLKVVAIKQITEDAQMRSEQQLAFVREMSVLTQVPPHCIRIIRIIRSILKLFRCLWLWWFDVHLF